MKGLINSKIMICNCDHCIEIKKQLNRAELRQSELRKEGSKDVRNAHQ